MSKRIIYASVVLVPLICLLIIVKLRTYEKPKTLDEIVDSFIPIFQEYMINSDPSYEEEYKSYFEPIDESESTNRITDVMERVEHKTNIIYKNVDKHKSIIIFAVDGEELTACIEFNNSNKIRTLNLIQSSNKEYYFGKDLF